MRDRPRLHLRRESEADERAIQFLKELVAATPTQRNWRGILISLLVIGLVSSLIVTCVILLTPPDLGPRIRGHLVTLEDIVKSTYRVQHDDAAWITDDVITYRDDDGGVSAYHVLRNATTVLVSNVTMRQKHSERALVSPDLNFVILFGRRKKLTEYTGEAPCWLLSVNSGRVSALKPEPWSERHPALQHAAWMAGSALLMLHGGNIYYKARALSADSFAVTSDGRAGLLQHGLPDLLYAEHILRAESAVWPSPDGTLLLYFSFNCTAVAELHYTEYGAAAEPAYPRVRSVRYPRAGAVNPSLTVTVANVTNPVRMDYRTVLPPAGLSDSELYAAGVRWLDNSRASVTWYNRRQNVSHVSVCSAPSWRCRTVYQSQSPRGWVPIGDGPVFSESGSAAALLDRVQDGDHGLYTQILMVELGAGRSVTQMTQNRADVTRILAWTKGFIYYLSAVEGWPGERHLYRLSEHRSPLRRTVHCLTCPAAEGAPGPRCLQHEALVAAGGRYALRCVGPDVPRLTLAAPAGAVSLRNSTALRAAAAGLAAPAVRLLAVPLPAGRAATVRLLVPPQYRDGDQAAYPLLLWLAPGAAADRRWRVDWPAYLASQQSFVVATVEVPAAAGAEVPVGAAETAALRLVVSQLTEKLSFVSASRVLVAGWQYGGYLAASLLASAAPGQQLRCAVAVAPIANWELYASAASERRLGDPHTNQRGYSESAVGGAGLVGRRLLLVHGTADTSVSVQHTLLLARRLQRAGALFSQMLYPDEGHQLDGVREHLYRTLDQYLHECFLPDNVRQLVAETI
ncbi:inactive dipeptidyl peptidase 10-like isoform X2 [Amphibalanus amphitrite]|uniref:inactive dipeptidyl peptidase 10-like isoform X2 n=1 Tax=Amphibalanus amphitrite TaxID=1232801 RepID=UPI001C926E28|nr:inactive dipeptidyl peptidase 10-like isoform X2 [Amphibalanus amphitrite]